MKRTQVDSRHTKSNYSQMIDYFITSLVIILMGLALWVFPPAKRTAKYGYRSKLSLLSQENWDLSQRLSARYLTLLGIMSMLIAILLYLFTPSDNARLFAVVLPVVGVFLAIRLIEKKLK